MKKAKVTIIVPIYNAEKYLKRSLDSIVSQTYADLRVLLVNDGSTDGSLEICESYRERYPYIEIIDKENGGANSARRAGIEKADTEYIAFVDADDWIDDDFVECMMREISDADIVCAGMKMITEDGKKSEHREKIPAGCYASDEERNYVYGGMLQFHTGELYGISPYSWNKLYRKEILQPILSAMDDRIFDGEDVAFVYPYLLKAKKIIVSEYCGYDYFFHKDSISNRERAVDYYNESCLYAWLYERFMESDRRGSLLAQLNTYMLHMLWKRDPDPFADEERIFPFYKVPSGSRIVLYGAGNIGAMYLRQIEKSGYCRVIAVADQKYRQNGKADRIAPEEIARMECDYVVLALGRKKMIAQVKEYLIGQGIDESKIVF